MFIDILGDDPYYAPRVTPRNDARTFPAEGSLRYRGALPKIVGGITTDVSGSAPPGGFTRPDMALGPRPTPPTAGAAEKIILGEIFDDLLALSFAGFL